MLTTTESSEPVKWRFYHASHVPDLDSGTFMDLILSDSLDGSLQVEDLSLGEQVNGDLDMMHNSGMVDYDFSPGRGSPRAPVKAVHDLSMMFPDTDSGFGSYKSRGRQIEDFTPTLSRLPRSRSLTRLNGLTTQDISEVLQEKPVRHIQTQLEESESRRTVLMHKLKEAQATLELQNDRLSKIENSAKDNSVLVEDLKFKEREYRKKIAQLQASEEEKQMLQMENIRLREEMQDRIDVLDFQLKTLKNQHLTTEDENDRRVNLLDQTTTALSLLEEENTRLQMDRDKLREEIGVMKEAFQLSKTRYSSVEEDSKTHKAEADRLREENLGLNKRVHEMAGQMMELRNLLQAVKDDNERLSTSWKSASEDKNRASRKVEGYQDTLADLKSRLSSAVAEKDRLFQERLDLNNKVQKMILEKEQLLKAQMFLEEQIGDQQNALDKTQYSTSQQDNQKKYLEDELAAVKRVSEDLSSELASVKAFYERALEQLSLAENSKKLQEQQLQLAEQERRRLQGEVDRLAHIVDGRHRDDREERQHLEETILKMRSEMKDLKYDKERLSKKCHEFETKLNKANEEIRGGIGKQYEELETWKTTCDRLTASVSRKETDLANLSDKCRNLESQMSRAHEDLRLSREKEEISSDTKEELERLRDENRRLLQEKAENEQMLQLLETQRDVLTKSTESSLNKLQDVEQLSGKVDQMRNENELLRQRISELEKVRDNLIKQKEELLASSELIYKSQGLEELEGKMEELREANKQLRDINEVMSGKLQIVEQENLRLKQSIGDGSAREEVKRLREENNRLLGESSKMRQEMQEQAVHKDTEAATKVSSEVQKIRKERDALQKQVQLINGQLNLLEGSKKRSDDTAQRSQDELAQMRTQLDASRKECTEAKRVAAQVKSLSEQLHKAKDQQESQEKLIRTMKEELEEERSKKPARIQESLEDVGAELQQMSGQLHKLMREIENKEQTIESLEGELRSAKDTAEAKEHTVSELKKLVSDLEQQNTTLKNNLDIKQVEPSDEQRLSLVAKAGEKSLKEELEEAVKNKQDPPRSSVRSKSMIPVKLGGGFHTRLTFTKEEDRLAEEAIKQKTSAGEKSVSAEQPSSRLLQPQPAPGTSAPTESKSPSPQLPLFVLTEPSSSSEEISDTSREMTSPEGYPKTSTPVQPAEPPKKFLFSSHLKESGNKRTHRTAHHALPSKLGSRALLSNVRLESSEPGTDQTDLSSGEQGKSPMSDKSRSGTTPESKDHRDFPPVTPPPVDQTKPKLSFAKPQPAFKSKARKLPQIKLPLRDQSPPSAARTIPEAKVGRSIGNVGVAKVDSARQRSSLSPAPKVPVPGPKMSPKPKSSPRESRNLFMSRRELTGKPSKLLSDSGVTVIATKRGSSPNTTTDVKYVVKKETRKDQDGSVISPPPAGLVSPPAAGLVSPPTGLVSPPSDGLMSPPSDGLMSPPSDGLMSPPSEGVMSPPSEGLMSPPSDDLMSPPPASQDSLLKSFDELLGGDGGPKSSQSSGFVSSGSTAGNATTPKSPASEPVTKPSVTKEQPVTKAKSESVYSKLKAHAPSQQPVWKSAASSAPSSSQETSATPPTPTLTKSSSVKDFLAAFSSAGEKRQDKGKESDGAQAKEDKSRVKSSFSRFSSSKSAASHPKKESSSEEPPSESFESLEESILPKDEAEKEKLAQLILTLASQPSLGSSLSSTDSWTLLLDETAGERTLSYEKLEQLANKAKSSGNKSKESKESKATDKSGKGQGSQDKAGMVRSSSTSSLSSGATMASIMRESLEEGQPAKFKPATGLFLSKSLGHPISAVTGGGSGDSGNLSVHRGRYGSMFFNKPDRPASESGDRLQSLISKYRSHSSDTAGGISSPGPGGKARGSSAPPSVKPSGLGRGFTPGTPKAPLLRSTSPSGDTSSQKSGKKLPPPPPAPKPSPSLMRTTSVEGGAKAEGAGQSGEMLDSQEQSDINALIQKPSGDTHLTKSLLSVHPPKITSTSKSLKCKREQKKR